MERVYRAAIYFHIVIEKYWIIFKLIASNIHHEPDIVHQPRMTLPLFKGALSVRSHYFGRSNPIFCQIARKENAGIIAASMGKSPEGDKIYTPILHRRLNGSAKLHRQSAGQRSSVSIHSILHIEGCALPNARCPKPLVVLDSSPIANRRGDVRPHSHLPRNLEMLQIIRHYSLRC